MRDDADDVFGPVVHPGAPEPAAEQVPRLRQSEMRPLSEIQADLRRETLDRAAGKFRRGRRV